MKIARVLAIATLFMSALSSAASILPLAPEPPFRTYSVADGLNQSAALAVVQDHDGFIWIATFGGLNRFDGRNFESLTTRQGLRQNQIFALAVDRNNRLWAGDTAGGLTLIEEGKVIQTFEPDPQNRGVARSIIEFKDTLYIASQPGGLRALSLSNLEDGIYPVEGAPNELLALVVRNADEIVAMSSVGLHLFKPNAEPQFELIAEGVSALISDNSGKIAVGDKEGRVGWLKDSRIEWLDLRYDGVVSALEMKNGDIEWVVVEGKGMLPYGDPNAAVVLPHGGDAPALRDQEGVLWVPSRDGLARHLGSMFQYFPLEFEGVKPEVYSIRPGVQRDFWFGTSLGLLHVDREGSLSNISDRLGIERREVRDIRLTKDKSTLWIGQVRGPVYAIDPSAFVIQKALGDSNTLTMSLELDAEDRVWFGSYVGILTVYNPRTDVSKSFEIENGASVYSLDMASDGYLWIAAHYKGIYRLDTDNPNAKPEAVVTDQVLQQEIYTQVVAQGAGANTAVWFVSGQGGVFRWRDGQVTRIIPEDALPDTTMYSIAVLPDNTLALATSRGAYRFDLASKALEHYSALDGFVSIEGNAHANYFDGEHSLLIGTTAGVTVMDIRDPMMVPQPPKPQITDRTVDGLSVLTSGQLPHELTADKVLISFTAISTRKPFGIEYSYRLDGHDEEWSVPSITTSIGYSNLKPGPYQFQVRARLPGGEWSNSATWVFVVPAPFWLSYWFMALAVSLILTLSWWVDQLRLRATEHINRRLRSEVAERTASIESARRELVLANEQLSSEMHERQKANALRVEVEARFHQAYQNSPIGMALVDTKGIVYDANPRMKALFWPDSKQDVQEPLEQVVVESDRDRFSDFFANYIIESAELASMEVECRSHNGEMRHIDFQPSAVLDQEGALKYVVLLAHDVTESRAMTNQLEYQARFDELTGLINRRAFGQRLKEVGDGVRDNRVFLMFLDLDQFKVVNDTCGHAAGDELLRQVAGILEKCVREEDTVARLGGDEFALLLVGVNQEVALERAENVRQSIQDLEFIWEQELFRIGVSIGIVPVQKNSFDLKELPQLADAACYAAKEAGRNRVHLVDSTEDAAHEHRGEMRWVKRLNQAVDTDNFVLFGQQILALDPADSEKHRMEILLRMLDRRNNRLIPPGAFLPAAERYGLRGRLDQWVVDKVLSILSAQEPGCLARQQLWVNLSGASVGDTQVSQALIRSVEAADLPPGCLNFEITETAIIRKLDDAADLVKALQNMGCRFALDDFGSGFSSFGYLKRLNVDYVKIDGQFVRDITTDPTDRIFVKSIIDIAQTLGMRVVSEFVEDDETLAMVRELGSDYAQGFGIHRPEPLASLVKISAPVPVDHKLTLEGTHNTL
ncbi:MAG: EAL domain-containing protein [Congregibacter sp.]